MPRQDRRPTKAFRPPVMRASILRLSILGRASEIDNRISSDPGLNMHRQLREEFKQTVPDLIGGEREGIRKRKIRMVKEMGGGKRASGYVRGKKGLVVCVV